jgi:hypothetical protein
MASNVSNISCKFPIPDCFYTKDAMSLKELKVAIQATFDCCATARNNVHKQLNAIYGKKGDISGENLDDKGHIIFSNFIKTICDDCDESNSAYKFYGKQIIDQINSLTDYINEAKLILSKWDESVSSNASVYPDVVRLECLHQFCSEIKAKFGTRYYYDFDEDNWKLAVDDYCGDSCSCCEVVGETVKTTSGESFYSQIKNKYDSTTNKDGYKSLEDLYNTGVKADSGNNACEKKLECFNELNLLDRLKYIKVYYDIKNGKTDYVFPDDKEHGFPCVNEADRLKTDARIANLEKFYVGYLIDRDGPVNAFCSLFEIKIDALQASISEMAKRIKAMNVYLDFINSGMDVLNQSQSDGKKKRIPDGAVLALTYLCGQKMYNLFEASNGNKYVVVPLVIGEYAGKYILLRADESGKRFFIGDDGSKGEGRGNGSCGTTLIADSGLFDFVIYGYEASKPNYITSVGDTPKGSYATKEIGANTTFPYYVRGIDTIKETTFELPKELEVSSIIPGSVKYYTTANDKGKLEDLKENEHTAMIESWTSAFKKKIEYINDAIKLINTDIEQYRNKINTYYSQSSTFRSRVEEVYSNSARKIL